MKVFCYMEKTKIKFLGNPLIFRFICFSLTLFGLSFKPIQAQVSLLEDLGFIPTQIQSKIQSKNGKKMLRFWPRSAIFRFWPHSAKKFRFWLRTAKFFDCGRATRTFSILAAQREILSILVMQRKIFRF